METLVANPGRSLAKRRQRVALAHGARSAFDVSGLSTFRDDVFRPHRLKRGDPAAMIATDMARTMDSFGRSATHARRALQAGIRIDEVDPVFTRSDDSQESSDMLAHSACPSRGTRLKNIA